MIFYVDRQQSSAPPPEVSETETVKNLANVNKSSLALEPLPDAPNKFMLTFTADTQAPTDVTVYFATTEKPDPESPGLGGAMFVSQSAQLPIHAILGGKLEIGSNVRYTTPASQAFDVERYASHLTHSDTAAANYPIVVQLSYDVPKEQEEASASDEKGKEKEKEVPKNPIRRQYTYAQISTSTDNGVTTYKVKPIRQRLQVDGNLYEVEDIYGMDSGGPSAVEGQVVDGAVDQVEVEGEQCVICLANDRDTIVMPCRHLCLCGDCAEVLRRQTNKCPICRTVIERLITKKSDNDK
jgi:hypothetical protein